MRWLRRPGRLRRLGPTDRRAALDLLATDPVQSILARVPIEEGWARPSHALGLVDDAGRLTAVAWNGANLVPFGFDDAGLDLLADHVLFTRRIFSSLVGPREQVMPLWERIEAGVGPAREVRESQLSMVYRGGEVMAPDPRVRPARIGEGSLVLPASVAMFTEEVGYNPLAYGTGYSHRVHSLVRAGQTFVRMGIGADGRERVEFKADIGALAGGVAQIQGVWTAPDLRGQGIATAAMVQVARTVRETMAPTVSLYVNDYNVPAVRVYEKAGFVTVGEYSTILL